MVTKKLLISLCLLPLLVNTAHGLIIPANRTYPWQGNVGVEGGIPDSSAMTVYTTLSSGTSQSQLQSAINACPSNQVVQLGNGTFSIANDIKMKTGVVLRGNGMTNTTLVFAAGSIYAGGTTLYNALRSASYSGGGTANWTAGYAQGASNLTFSTVSPGLTVGNLVFLDQRDDSYFVNGNGYEGNSGGPRDDTHNTVQIAKVTAINGNIVTVWPPIASTWISGSLNPGAVWVGVSGWDSRMGVENMTIDCSSASSGHGPFSSIIDFQCVHNSWVKGVKGINAKKVHVFFGYGYFRNEVRDCYFFGTQSTTQQSYGIALDWGGHSLFENNIFEKIVLGMATHQANCCNVFGYNYVTNAYYTASANFNMAGAQPHDKHVYFELYEGNHFTKFAADFIHGSHSHETLFRNRITGWAPFSYPNGETTHNLGCELIDITNRFMSSVGNILGTAGKIFNYQSVPGAHTSISIYEIGLENTAYGKGWGDDTQTIGTLFRHMDYDTVTAGIAYNSTNADVTLPSSLYYSSKPAWWGSLAWPPFNPTNTSAAQMDPTNLPAGYRHRFGVAPPLDSNPPTITTQPVGVTNDTIGGFTLSVGASGSGLTYQWKTNGNNVAGATSATYGSTPAFTIQSGTYTVAVSNSFGGVVSAGASLLITNATVAPPSITVQPAGVTNSTDNGITPPLSVTAAGGGTLVYQWRLYATNVPSATNSTYTSVPALTTQSGPYTCFITNISGSITTAVAYASITNISATAPTFTLQPVGTTNSILSGFNLSVAANGTPPIYWQWFSNSTAMVGQTNSSFGSRPATTNQSASYSVSASNSVAVVPSQAALVSMTNANVTLLVLAMGFEQGTGTNVADSSSYGNDGTLAGGATWVAGKYGLGIYCPTNDTATMLTIPYSSSIDQFTNAGITIEAWVYPMISGSSWGTLFYHWDGLGNGYILNGRTSSGGVPMWTILNAQQYAPTAFTVSNWVHIACTYDKTNRVVYTNGIVAASIAANTNMISPGNYPLTIGGNTYFPTETFGGIIDEVRIYNRALSQAAIQADMNTPIVGGPVAISLSAPTTSPFFTNVSAFTYAGTSSYDTNVTAVTFTNRTILKAFTVTGTTNWTVAVTNAPGTNFNEVYASGGTQVAALTNIFVLDTTNPVCTITAPTATTSWDTTVANLDIGGTASDGQTGVVLVSWTNTRGGAGVCTGTTTWSAQSILLLSGGNVITVTAYDAAGNSFSDAFTVIYTPGGNGGISPPPSGLKVISGGGPP